ncbi:MAG: hypothetical protein PHI42_08970 [Paludibacteraceae bacterium]|jgi:hypothetical protein|nr:hypothetical protein [Paludibacteraceae bacterium]
MDFNLLKKYPELLGLAYLTVYQRNNSLKNIFKRDIEDNIGLDFRGKHVRPIKEEGQASMDTLFHHLTTCKDLDEKGKETGSRSFEMARSQRLHWIKYHIDENKNENMDIFSYQDRIKGKDIVRTYIYDRDQQYVIILEPQRSGMDYYLLTAYYLNESYGKKQIENKRKKKLPNVY